MDTVKNEISEYIENIGLILLGIVFLTFPLIVTNLTTDPFTLPKQIVLGGITLVLLLFFGVKMISDGAVRLRRTPFDIFLIGFTIVLLLSSFFSINRYDSLIAYVPLFLSVIFYFLVVNFVKSKQALFFLLTSLIIGGVVVSILSILSFFNIFILPFAFTKAQTFSPLGSILDQIVYLVLLVPIALSLGWEPLKHLFGIFGILETTSNEEFSFDDKVLKAVGYLAASVLLVAGIGISVYELFVIKPGGGLLLLPFEVGFQTAFASISQDAGRALYGFLFGSGFGTFLSDFARFKQSLPFNASQTLWSLSFIRSSSFVLELLATTGVAGLTFFILLLLQIVRRVKGKSTRENPLFFSMLFVIIACFFLPFSPIMQTLFFLLLAGFSASEGLHDQHKFFDVELHFIAFKRGIMPFMTTPVSEPSQATAAERIEDKSFTKALPIVFFTLFLLTCAGVGFYSYKFVYSDILFQDSLVAFAANDGLKTYNSQTNAITLFPYRDAYHRIYAQTNLALANSIASQQPNNASPSADTQKTITTLIQQAINASRNATTIAPITSLNWQNLSSVYRALIGYGQGAADFAVAAQQQAIALDQNNPQGYVILGGIYYQLGQWDNAQRQFQTAITLKQDFANAYYNFGHTLESKGDLPNALVYYRAVKSLVVNDAPSLKVIDNEITVLEGKIGAATGEKKIDETALTPTRNQPPLGVSTPENKLPERNPQVNLEPTKEATKSAR